jgi:hypothetical protein
MPICFFNLKMEAFPDYNEKTKQVIVLPGCVMDTESDVIFETTTGIGLEEHKRFSGRKVELDH